MSRTHAMPSLAAVLAVAAVLATPAPADVVEMTTVKDNTLIEDPGVPVSAGASTSFYAGRVGSNGGGTLRRGVIAFDVAASVPAGSTITAVSLTLRCSKVPSGSPAQLIRLHRMVASWGEGASVAFGGGGAPATPGSATWLSRFHPELPWTTPGGQFAASPSGSTSVGAIGFYTWASTPGMVADVQAWLDDPSSNHGWAVIGNELVQQSVRRFETRESTTAWRPKLVITFSPPAANPFDLNGDGVVNGADLSILLSQWGGPGSADFDGNGVVNGADLASLLAAWN